MIITDVWMPISPMKVVETDQFTVSDSIVGGTTISALEARLYLGNTDKTYTTMTGSSQSFTGNRYVTNMIQNLKGGNTYILSCRVTVDGEVKTRKLEIRVQKEGDLS